VKEVDCRLLVSAYVDWLKAKITTADINGACEITTPFLDRHNDRLQIYVQNLEDRIRLTDDGYIIGDLEASGCQIDTPKRQALLGTILNGFGVRHEAGELFVEATPQEFPKKKHALLQAMLTVNDMFMTSKQRVVSLFIEDVKQFLDEHEVRNSPQVEFTGKSGYLHRFDFVIPKSKKMPERLLRAINHPSRDSATSFLFAWTDTKDTRPPNSLAYAVLNDAENALSSDVLAAFQHYDVRPILWSQRGQFIDEFAA
jgi:hypothetical protein